MSVDFLTPGIKVANQAVEYDNNKKYEKAFSSYILACEYLSKAIKHNKNTQRKKMIREKLVGLMDRTEQIKKYLKAGKDKQPMTEDGGTGDGKTLDKESNKFEKQLLSTVIVEKPDVKWEDVAGLDVAKEALQEAVILPAQYPQLFKKEEGRDTWKGILLYGPPGTGKSFLAKACATECDSSFINVSSSNLTSKWVGEAEKMVKALFNLARKRKPCIIFIDEIDSLCGERDSGGGGGGGLQRLKTEFLVNMDGVGSDSDGILVLGATNLPWTLDSAILRRFERRIHIGIPSSEAREVIAKLKLKKAKHTLKESDFKQIGLLTEGMSGADVATIVKNSLILGTRKVIKSTHFRKIKGVDADGVECDDCYEPCSPGAPGAVEINLKKINKKKILNPPVTMDDFLHAIKSTKTSVKQKDLKKCDEFTQEYGIEG